METKLCSACATEKPLDDFHLKSSGVKGRREKCKACRSGRKPREWDEGVRTCKSCEETKPSSDFPLNAQKNPRSVCKKCASRYSQYGLTKNDTEGLLEKQNYLCLICDRDLVGKRFVIDHDHACCPPKLKTCGKCVRGILCTSCNSQLGWHERYSGRIADYLGGVH